MFLTPDMPSSSVRALNALQGPLKDQGVGLEGRLGNPKRAPNVGGFACFCEYRYVQPVFTWIDSKTKLDLLLLGKEKNGKKKKKLSHLPNV